MWDRIVVIITGTFVSLTKRMVDLSERVRNPPWDASSAATQRLPALDRLFIMSAGSETTFPVFTTRPRRAEDELDAGRDDDAGSTAEVESVDTRVRAD